MDDRLTALEREVALLARRVTDLASRLDSLSPAAPALEAPPESVAAAAPTAQAQGPGLATLAGRSFIVLGGAFLLRALTQVSQGSSETMMDGLGVLLGMAYAAVWLYLADRAAKAGHATDAAVHGVVTTAIAFPMIWESTTRFHVLGPSAAAAATFAFGVAMIVLAARRDLPLMAWIGGAAAIATASALILATGAPWALLGVALLLCASCLALAELKGWPLVRWPVALVLDLLALLTLVLCGRRNYEWLTPSIVAVIVLAIAAVFVVAFVVCTLARRSAAGPFEVLQSLALLGLSYAGGRFVLADSSLAQVALPAMLLVLGALCLVAVFALLERREGQGANIACYTLFGVALVIEGVRSLTPGGAAPMLAAGALVAARLGVDPRRWALRLSAAVMAVVAAIASGALSTTRDAFAGTSDAPLSIGNLSVLALVIAAYVALRRSVATGKGLASLTFIGVGFVLIVVAIGSASGVLVLALVPLVQRADLGALAVLRTAALSALIVAVAWAARGRAREELVWATWVTLGVAGVKILADDFRHGRASTLFLTLAIYGGILILAPWLLRKARAAAGT